MDKELELENEFIQLWNDGHSYDEIAEEIGVDIEKIRQWGSDLIIANNELFDESKFAVEKITDGKYIGQSLNNLPYKFLFKLEESIDDVYWERINILIPHVSSLVGFKKENKKITFLFNFEEGEISKTYLNSFTLSVFTKERIKKKGNYEFRIMAIVPLIKESIDKRMFINEFRDFPFCIKQFTFQSYKGIKNVTVKQLPINSQWIFLTGKNGYGKTTILQALANSIIRGIDENERFYSRLAIELKVDFENFVSNPNSETIEFKNFAAYGASRLTLQEREAQNKESRRSETLYSLFNSDGILLNIEYRLFISSLKDIDKFEKIKKLLITVVPDLKDIEIKDEEVFYIEKSQEGEAYQPVTFDELAAGYKSVIAMVGDIYLRLSKNQPDIDIKDLGGIVLIDELDVHLHPKWQRALPGLLSKAFPKVQFIASTHSPIPFLGAPKNAVFLKVDRTPEEGITCKRIDIDVTNLTPNLILTSPIFGFDEIVSDHAKNNIEDIRTEDTYEELKKNKALREELKALYKSGKSFPDELFETAEK